MKEFALLALDAAKTFGATYADIRIIQTKRQAIRVKDGKIGAIDSIEDVGFGVRVIADGAWGFASSDDLSKETLERIAKQAVETARASALFKRGEVVFAEEPHHVDVWQTPFVKDPFKIALSTKIDLLVEIDKRLRQVKGVQVSEASMDFRSEDQVFANTEGSYIQQFLMNSGAGYSATARDEHDIQVRSYPSSFGGQYQTRGYELIEELALVENAERIAEEAVALLSAPQCPSGQKDLVLEGSQLALQIHESCGHPIELDRVLGSEANYAGTSFLTTDKLGKLKYGSDIVNIVADATLGHGPGLGTFGYDDEGVPAQRTEIVKNGLFAGYMTSRETAPVIGQKRSNGTMRADGWNRIPLIRMTNVSLLPGTWTLEDLIADTKDGILMETNRSWSIDDKRLNFQFGTEVGWEIKNGKKTRMVKNPTYGGMTTAFWNACDAICNNNYWMLWGTPNCGKGQPGQTAGTGHGAAPARFRNINVGIGYTR